MRQYLYAQTPEPLWRDKSVTVTELRCYDLLDFQSGPRGYWIDSLSGLADALEATREAVSRAIRRLVERGLIQVEKLTAWRWRFVVPERISGQQLALDEYPPEALRDRRRARSPRVKLTAQPPAADGSAVSSADRTFFRSQTASPQRSDPPAVAGAAHAQPPDQEAQQEPEGEPSAPPPARYGLATKPRGRGRLDGLHERYHARLTDWGLGQPATASEWRLADAKVLQWARLEPRATAAALDATVGHAVAPAHATEAGRPWTREESEARRLAIDAEVLGRRVAS